MIPRVRWRGACAGVLLAAGLHAPAQEPVQGDYWAHDPSTMIADGDRYYIFRTSSGIMAKHSADKVNWSYGGRVFPSGPPAWTLAAVPGFDGFFWAPDVAFFNGRYHLYYSCSTFGSQVSAIGLVTSPSLENPNWTDRGPVIQSSGAVNYNAIDPAILVDDDGRVWMAFGSYWNGIFVTELDPLTGLRISDASPLIRLADNGSIEAAFLFQRDGYYYLFVNHGSCCSGIDSTYRIRVGRSTSVTGPYIDRAGVSLVSGGGTLVAESTGHFVGPGHAGILAEDGADWFTYHYYDANNATPGEPTLGLARLQWTAEGWPRVVNDWSAFYSFEADAREHRGAYDGVLEGTAAVIAEPGRGRVLNLDGATGLVTLPNPVANASTFTAWVKWHGGGTWQRIFDFGDGTSRYLFLSPRAANGRYRFAITIPGTGEQVLDGPTALPQGSWCHLAVSLGEDGEGILYFNGDPVTTNRQMTLRPWEVQARANYLGDSQWTPDPLFNGQLDSMRVFGRALEPAEIRDLALAHPSLAHRYSFTEGARDTIGRAHGTLQGNAFLTNGKVRLDGTSGTYVDLPGGLVSGAAAVTVEFWSFTTPGGIWVRIFDFGRTEEGTGREYLFYSPRTGLDDSRLELATEDGFVTLTGDAILQRQITHFACIVDPVAGYMAVFHDGEKVSEHIGSLPALSGVSRELSYLGRSLFSADAWLNGVIDEFRIYDGRLTPAEIAANRAAGPDALALPVSLAWQQTGPTLTLSWPAYALAFAPESSDNVTEPTSWLPLPEIPWLNNDRWWLALPATEPHRSHRLHR